MKKTYINPAMEIVKIAANQQMLAGSTPEQGFNRGTAETIDATSGNMARDFDFEDEEEF